MKMKITGNSARNLNKAALNSGRATRRPMNSSRKTDERRQLNCNHNATRRPAVNAASRRPLAPVATERPMLNSSARRPVSRLTNTKADLKSSRRPVRPLATDDKNYKLNSARRRPLKKLNSNRSAILKELEGWFDKDEAVEYLNSFEEQTGATATKLATDEEVDKYDGVFWATKDGKESLWCLHNGMWLEDPQNTEFGLGNLLDSTGVSGTITAELPNVKNVFDTWLQKANQKYGLNLAVESWYVSDAGVLNIEYSDDNDFDGVDQEAFMSDYRNFVKKTLLPATAASQLEKIQIVGGPDGYYNEWDIVDVKSSRKLNSAEGEATEEAESTETPSESTAEETTAEETAEEEIEVTDFLIVQDPESKELSLFIPDTPEEAVPEDVEVIATVESATAEDLDSSCGGKKKLNSSEEDGAEAATEDEAKEDTAEEAESTEEEEAVVELPDGETVEVEDIFVVQTDDGEYDLFIAEEDAELPEEVEVVGEAVAVEEDEILNSSRQLKKLNSSKDTDKKATK